MLTIISKSNLAIKDIKQVSDYTIEENIELNGNSVFTLSEKPIAVKGDYVKKDGFIGFISKLETSKDSLIYKLYVDDLTELFNRNILISNESLITSTGIEDFIVSMITNNFKTTGDTLMNISYLNPSASSHTPLNIVVETSDGVFNFKGFLALAKQLYNIELSFSFTTTLNVVVSKNTQTAYGLDLGISDIIDYDEVYSEDVIAKVIVKSLATSTLFNYYLKSDRTITTNASDVLRVTGKVESVVCDVDAEAEQKAIDTFKSNQYAHNVSFRLDTSSSVYDISELKPNRLLIIKTLDNGIYYTYVAKIKTKMKSNIAEVECGSIRVKLTDKLKGVL